MPTTTALTLPLSSASYQPCLLPLHCPLPNSGRKVAWVQLLASLCSQSFMMADVCQVLWKFLDCVLNFFLHLWVGKLLTLVNYSDSVTHTREPSTPRSGLNGQFSPHIWRFTVKVRETLKKSRFSLKMWWVWGEKSIHTLCIQIDSKPKPPRASFGAVSELDIGQTLFP